MNFLICEHELIHGGDHDVEDNDDWLIESNLSCPECGSIVFVLWPAQDKRDIPVAANQNMDAGAGIEPA